MTASSAFQPSLTPAQVTEPTRLLGEIDEFKGHWRRLGEIRAERLASLALLVEHGLLDAHGERKGRYYSRRMNPPQDTLHNPQSRNAAILAAILERGGSVSRGELLSLVDLHGSDHRIVGALHGRRLAHLRRNPKTRRSTLTARGRELAEQFLFAKRLARTPPSEVRAADG